MRARDEMAVYIEEMIQHERECEAEDCPLCDSARNIYRLVRNLIFAEVVYPDVTVVARGRRAKTESPVASVAPRAA